MEWNSVKLKSFSYVLLTFVLITLLLDLPSTAGADVTATIPPAKSCKSIVADLNKRQISGIASCAKSMKFKNGKEKAAKMNCILRCVMIREKLLAENGTLSEEVLNTFVAKEFPGSIFPRATELITACRVKHADELDPEEEFCKSYDGFIKCLLSAMNNLCK